MIRRWKLMSESTNVFCLHGYCVIADRMLEKVNIVRVFGETTELMTIPEILAWGSSNATSIWLLGILEQKEVNQLCLASFTESHVSSENSFTTSCSMRFWTRQSALFRETYKYVMFFRWISMTACCCLPQFSWISQNADTHNLIYSSNPSSFESVRGLH